MEYSTTKKRPNKKRPNIVLYIFGRPTILEMYCAAVFHYSTTVHFHTSSPPYISNIVSLYILLYKTMAQQLIPIIGETTLRRSQRWNSTIPLCPLSDWSVVHTRSSFAKR